MYFFRVFIKELRRDMKLNPKNPLPKALNINHIIDDKQVLSEIDEEDEDKFEDLEHGKNDFKEQ